jgi:tRNA G26 N,N-dimethylase Trm1
VIEVFKTDVRTKKQANKILTQLLIQYPEAQINFDLNDCDKILRVDAVKIFVDEIIEQLKQVGFKCEVLT